jgi:hypothetical protein
MWAVKTTPHINQGKGTKLILSLSIYCHVSSCPLNAKRKKEHVQQFDPHLLKAA